MSSQNTDECTGAILEMSRTEKFSEMFSELERCNEGAQKQKILEMNELIDEMDKDEFVSVSTIELLYKINHMIYQKKISMGNAVLLLKHVLFCNVLLNMSSHGFHVFILDEKFGKMIVKEGQKKKKRNEKLLVYLCECYLFFTYTIWPEMISICVPCLLKAALKKEESKEAQKEVEIALLSLSCIDFLSDMEKELYLNEITDIIKYHQEHRSLTRLAYQSAWRFLIDRFHKDYSLKDIVVNELHFAREAGRELEDLMKCIDWKGKEEENGRMEVIFIRRWIDVVSIFFNWSLSWNEELAGLIGCLVDLFRASRDNYVEIRKQCICSFEEAVRNPTLKIDDLLKSGAVDLYLEEMKQSTLDERLEFECLQFFLKISERLIEKRDGETNKTKRKELKRKVFEKMEEEGYEDYIIGLFHNICYRTVSDSYLIENYPDCFFYL
ncbi:uncharacterized protein MONOS_8909 [Monocercomonoides exilis]|uniref:uncharacterized protein n=1 Tax=Monocercomonoides exilis TaxID=2049356 RepID=UPI003559B019|nr:hypothetical protein MONOS_8909 [Monocercomonoides exilis]